MAIRARTESKLLDAAEELFFSQGVAATPVDVVLERAGVSTATLYRGYASKDALLGAALERRHRAWIAAWDDAVAGHRTPEARLLAIFDALDGFGDRLAGARWCAVLGSAAEYAAAPTAVEDALRDDTEALRVRLHVLAIPVAGDDAAPELAEELLLVFTGQLAMRLRDPACGSATSRRVAAALIASAAGRA